jgi:hypothetical protein
MDNRGVRVDPDELKPMDSRGEQRRLRVLKIQAEIGKALTVRDKDSKGAGGTLREVSSGIWFKPDSMGWANGCNSSETVFRNKPEGAASPTLDASFGLSVKESELFLSSSTKPRSPKVPAGFKKNLSPWGPKRQLYSRMRQALRCTPGLAGAGRRKESVLRFPRPASIVSA